MRFNNRRTTSTSRKNLLYVSGQRHDSDSTCPKRVVISRPQIYLHKANTGEVHVSVDYLLFNNRNVFIFTVYKEGLY